MTLTRSLLSLAIAAAAFAPAAQAEIPIDVIAGSEVSFEALFQADYNYFDSDFRNLDDAVDNDGEDSDAAMRRAELIFKGKGPGPLGWTLGYDARANKWLDANVTYRFGWGLMTVGQFKQPNSLEELTSTKNNDFISKAVTTNLFAVARRTGISGAVERDHWTLTGSWFGRELTNNLAQGTGYGVRGTWTPIKADGNILSFGLSHTRFDVEDALGRDRTQLRARPNADLASARLIDAGLFTDGDHQTTNGAEAFYVNGPMKLQGEYMRSSITRYNNPTFTADSWYVYGVYNLTGETWGYKAGLPTTGLPNDPMKGLWQVGVRYDTADLNDNNVFGGTQDTWTVGVNWYARSNFKLSLNYVMVDSERGAVPVQDNPNIIEARFQIVL